MVDGAYNAIQAGQVTGVTLANRGEVVATSDGNGDITIPHGLLITPSYQGIKAAICGAVNYHCNVHTLASGSFKVRVFSGATIAAGVSVTVAWSAKIGV